MSERKRIPHIVAKSLRINQIDNILDPTIPHPKQTKQGCRSDVEHYSPHAISLLFQIQ